MGNVNFVASASYQTPDCMFSATERFLFSSDQWFPSLGARKCERTPYKHMVTAGCGFNTRCAMYVNFSSGLFYWNVRIHQMPRIFLCYVSQINYTVAIQRVH